MIRTYKSNYSPGNRGFRVGIAMTCMAIGGVIFTALTSKLLDQNQANFVYILWIAALAAFLCAFCFLKIPTKKVTSAQQVPHTQRPPLWDNFKLLLRDPLFSVMLLFYSFIAFANQMTLPLRTEYLANHRYGLDLSYKTTLEILAIAQPLACILSGPIWGKLYDRLSLIAVRQSITACFLVGVPLFFATDNLHVITLASIILGIGRGGGATFWSLWVSRIAPAEKVSEYMSADTAIIGLRDGLAPLIGYALLCHTNPLTVGIVAFILLLISLLGFEGIRRHPSYQRRIAEIGK
jgi:MFS family permease